MATGKVRFRTSMDAVIHRNVKAKHYALIFFFTLFSILTLLAGQSAYSQNTGMFRIGDYGTGARTGVWFYRGYVFQVPRETEVTHLVGGGTVNVFDVAIYEVDSSPDPDSTSMSPRGSHVPTAVIASASFEGSDTPQQVQELDSPVTLYPGEDYLIAQGRVEGLSGNHHLVRSLDIRFLSRHTRIESWYPDYERDWSLRFQSNMPAEEIVGNDITGYSGGALPRIGFHYDTHVEPAELSTGDANFNPDTADLTIEGRLHDTGGIAGEDPAFLYFEWGEDEDLSEYGTFVDATPLQTSEHNTDFSFDIPNAEPGTTYYYRAIVINDKRREEGEIRSYNPAPPFRLDAGELVTVGGLVGSRSATVLTTSDAVDWDRQESNSRYLLKDVVYDDAEGVFVAVGRWGSIVSSEDGIEWRQETTRAGQHIRGITLGTGPDGDDILVAVGNRGTVLTGAISLDAAGDDYNIQWETQNSGVRNTLNSVAFGDGMYVAVGTWGQILTSTDAETWTEQVSGERRTMLTDIVYGDDTWVAVGQYGTLLTSPDAIDWEKQESGVPGHLNSIAYGGDAFVAGGQGGTIITAEAGALDSWEEQSTPTSADIEGLTSVGLGDYGNPQFVAVGQEGLVMTSPNALLWRQRDSGTRSPLKSIVYTEEVPDVQQLRIETEGDGTGSRVLPQEMTEGETLTVYAVLRDQDNSFIQRADEASFSLVNVDGDLELTDHEDGSATFHANNPGHANIEATFRGMTDRTGLLTVVEDVPADPTINVEDDDDGDLVGDVTLDLGDELTVYAVERDADGEYVGLVTDTTWSLDDMTGDVDEGDLEDNEDGTATFHANNTGSAVIVATDPDDQLVSVPSGTITVEDPDEDENDEDNGNDDDNDNGNDDDDNGDEEDGDDNGDEEDGDDNNVEDGEIMAMVNDLSDR